MEEFYSVKNIDLGADGLDWSDAPSTTLTNEVMLVKLYTPLNLSFFTWNRYNTYALNWYALKETKNAEYLTCSAEMWIITWWGVNKANDGYCSIIAFWKCWRWQRLTPLLQPKFSCRAMQRMPTDHSLSQLSMRSLGVVEYGSAVFIRVLQNHKWKHQRGMAELLRS